MATDALTTDAARTRRRRKLCAGAAGVTALVVACLCIYLNSGPTPQPNHGLPEVVASATPAATPESAPASTPAPAVVARPVAGPPMLLASNAFTTLDDYRRRRAVAPQKPPPLTTPPAGRTPETELGRVTLLVRDYRAAFGENPVGSNKEITRALLGGNPRGTRFLDSASVSLDAKGEMLDAWGRPYFFHAMSGTMMEIRSAGPDGKLFTDDDLVK